MSTPYYVSPEQIMQDKADFVRTGIERAKEVIVLEYKDGIVMVAENPLTTLFKISEIYDRIALAATGRIAEYEALRYLGIREAEIKGYTFNRADVTAKWLTNNIFSQRIAAIFWQTDTKPLEVELLLCELRADPDSSHRIYQLSFDGTFWEEQKYAIIGGRSDEISEILEGAYEDGLELKDAVKLAVNGFETIEAKAEEDQRYHISADTLEVAVLDENRNRRKFRRLLPDELEEILAS